MTNAVAGALNATHSISGSSTILLTVISGVAVFVVGQVFVKLVLEPLLEMRKLLGGIAYSLSFYANALGSTAPSDVGDKARETYRSQACKLREMLEMFPAPLYWVLSFFRMLPGKRNAKKASRALIGLSNSRDGATDRPFLAMNQITEYLGLHDFNKPETEN